MHLYMALTAAAPQLKDRPAIGIISPYKAQVGRKASAGQSIPLAHPQRSQQRRRS